MKRPGKSKLIIVAVIAAVIILVIAWLGGTYNSFVTLDTQVDSEWSNVEVQYQRRADLVPSLVETVKGAANFEQGTLTAVTEARTKWLNAQGGDRPEAIAAANEFDSALSRLLVTVESYPTLTATENFRGLQAQLEGTENRIGVARTRYNEKVVPYNVKVKQFPGVFMARIFGFEERAFFEADENASEAPEVNFEN